MCHTWVYIRDLPFCIFKKPVCTPFYSYKIPGRVVFCGQMGFLNPLKKSTVKKCCFLYFLLQNSSLKPLIYFKLINRALKWILHPKFSMSWYIAHVFFTRLVQKLRFWPFWWRSSWMGYFEHSCQFRSVSAIFPTCMIILTNITPLILLSLAKALLVGYCSLWGRKIWLSALCYGLYTVAYLVGC